MTKDELIEQLARGICGRPYDYKQSMSAARVYECRASAEKLMPPIVMFVRDWLVTEFGTTEVDRWMDQMGTREVMTALREIEES